MAPTAGQMPRALGLAFASKCFREAQQKNEAEHTSLSNQGNEICFCTIGDASTSEGHFWESMNAAAVLQAIRGLESGQQITVLRNAVVDLGFDANKLGTYQTVAEPVVAPTEVSKRQKVSIEGITNVTVLNYMDNLNANDFDTLIELFTSDGALQPPFQRPIVGKDAILRFFKEECQNLKLIPEQGVVEPAADGYNQIKVTGKVQTPWFGAGVGMNMAWRFLLNPEDKIFFVAIDLLASPKELLNLARR
jgi:hypothetical protein